jgi:hypothetical protein
MAESNKVTEVRSEHWEPDLERQVLTYKATELVWLLLGILEALFGLRFLLKLIGANPHSPIAALIYDFTGLFLAPFSGLTPTPAVNGVVLEISTLFAMLVYGLVFWVVYRLLWLIFYRPRGSVIDLTETKSHQDLPQQHKP